MGDSNGWTIVGKVLADAILLGRVDVYVELKKPWVFPLDTGRSAGWVVHSLPWVTVEVRWGSKQLPGALAA